MKFLRIILISFVLIFGLFVIISFFLPSEFEINRSVMIKATPSAAFKQVSNFKSWEQWNPWSALDKDMTYRYSLNDSLLGSVMKWSSNNLKVGNIERKIIDFKPDALLVNSTVIEGRPGGIEKWEFTTSDNMTLVTWSQKVRLGFFFRFMGFMIARNTGDIMNSGLQNLKTFVERLPFVNINIYQEYIGNRTYIIKRGNAPHNDPAAISITLSNLYADLLNFANTNKLIITGQPIAINIEWGENYVFDAGLPVAPVSLIETNNNINYIKITAGKVVKGIYTGNYDSMAPAYDKILHYIRENNLVTDGFSWEEYISDPAYTSPDSLITYIYFPVK